MRLIDADELKKCVKNECRQEWKISRRFCMDFDDVIDCIDEQPTVDAEPMIHAHWVSADEKSRFVPLDKRGDTTDSCCCSHCGAWLDASDEYAVKGRYCPNCGAAMDEKEKR